MATRPVFVPIKCAPYVDRYHPEFVWSPGMAVSQQRKNIAALHNAFNARFPQRKVLEISSKSTQGSECLSAFRLMMEVPSLGKRVPVECVYQGSKRFAAGGPYTDLYLATSKEAKRDPRLKSSGELRAFTYEGRDYPLRPKTVFYNWLYINALLDNPECAAMVLEYDAFTDIAFNPDKSSNCQAEACAVFKALHTHGLLDKCRDFDEFLQLFVK